ncbi:MAG: lipid-A-disaccharide synthase, partial [Polyangiaceae bacterium]|nr:lipid-A-disaccharide synthase [Polyangiaceae bacterium]
MSLLIVTGEASGDRAAAAVAAQLRGVRAFGLGGPALAARGVELVEDIRASTALGIGEVGARSLQIWRAFRAVQRAVRSRRPSTALLVNYTEFNSRLAPRLRAAGVRVVWYIAPQIWAWRPRRALSLRRSLDRLAVILPFEEETWRRLGVDARYVGHPALEVPRFERLAARRILGLTPYAAAVAILPGSRPHEVRALLPAMLDAYERLRSERASVDARVLLAPSLDDDTRAWLRARCTARRVGVFEVDAAAGAMQMLPAFDVALCASGTVSLEATLARAVPVVAYRVGLSTEIAARIWVRTPHVALPNVILGRRVFPELLQRDARADRMAAAMDDALERRAAFTAACDEVEAALGTE